VPDWPGFSKSLLSKVIESGDLTAGVCHKLIKENESQHLVVERFDRGIDDEKIHLCSASGLMHIDISLA
jgi:hypothetical protein